MRNFVRWEKNTDFFISKKDALGEKKICPIGKKLESKMVIPL
jgi:hypothetical protein